MTMTLEEIAHFRSLRPERFDRHLELVVMQTEPGFADAVWSGSEIFYRDAKPDRRKLRVMSGAEALPYVLSACVKLDMAYERLTGEPIRVGLEQAQRVLGLSGRRVEAAYLKRRRVLEHGYSGLAGSWRPIAAVWLQRAAARLTDELQGASRPTTERRGAA